MSHAPSSPSLRAPRRGRRTLRSVVAAGLTLVMGFGAGALVAPATEAEAAVISPMTNVYDGVVNGNYLMVGNGVLQAGAPAVSGLTATNFHNGVQQTNLVNDNFVMERRNAVPALASAGADNSSSATLQVPQGASVTRAFLFWQGSTGQNSTANGVVQRCTANAGNNAVLAAGTPQQRSPMLQVGSGTIANITPSVVVEPAPTGNNAQYYSGQADVTQQLSALPSGSTQTINVGNIWAAEGRNCYAGWSLAVVYDFGTYVAGNDAAQARQVIISSGHVRIAPNESQLTTFSGFTSQSGDIQASFVLGEGDRNIVGDFGRYRAGTTGGFTTIPGATNEADNIGTGQATGSVRYQGTSSGPFFNGNVDTRTATLANIPSGTTQVQLELGTVADTYMLQASALAVPVPAIRIEKAFTGGPPNPVDVQHILPGQSPSYTITVTNAGSTTLTSIQVADQLAPSCARAVGTLAPGASTQFTCTGPPASQGFTSEATATGVSGGTGGTTVRATDTTRVNVGTIALAKSVTPAPGYTGRAGDVLNYSFAIRNSGTSTLTGVTLTDPMPRIQGLAIDWTTSSDAATPNGTLSPNETVTGRATYVLTQADVNAGGVTNPNARVTSRNPNDAEVAAGSSATQTVAAQPAVTLQKTGTLAAGSTGRAGDAVNYAFTATNTGNVTLTNVAIRDPQPGLTAVQYRWPGTAGTLQPGQTVTATATGTLTQAQVNAGGVTNTATVTGTPPTGAAVTANGTTTVPVAPTPAITVQKVGTVGGTGAAGDRIQYTFDVRNTGNVTLTGVTVADPRVSPAPAPPAGFDGTLQPGQTVRYTASHLITQANVDAGSYPNTATASGTPPTGAAVSNEGSFVAPLANAPGINLRKVGTHQPNGPGTADDTIAYTFTVTNTGRSTLNDVRVADPLLPADAPISYAWPGTAGQLAPGQSVQATATLPLTQDQIDAGRVVNTATASGTGGGATVEDPDTATTTIVATPNMTFDKSVTAPTGTPQAGTTVPYVFTIQNTGNVTLTGVSIDDPMFADDDLSYAWPGAVGTLAPGATVEVTATHALTQGEIDAGTLANTATASASTTGGIALERTDAVTIPLPQSNVLDLEKTATLADGDIGLVGDTIEYDFEIANDGNTTLGDVSLSDALEGLDGPTLVEWPGDEGTLLPGQSVRFTATYEITQADLDAGGVRNSATATASGPGDVELVDLDSVEVVLEPEPAIEIEKSVTVPEGARAGDAIAYAFTVSNVGTATLRDVGIDDPLLADGAVTFGAWPDPLRGGVLPPETSVDATASYTLTQADVDRGTVENTATASGTSAQGETVDDDDTATATLAQPQALTIAKSGSLRGSGGAGSIVDYTFTITNDGATTLSGVIVADPLEGLGDLTYAWPNADRPGVLAPGAVATATASYTVTQDDVDAGVVDNTATAQGSGPGGPVESDPVSETVELDQTSTLTLSKVADTGPRSVGSTITYTFTAQNTGNVRLTDVTIDDPLAGLSDLEYDWSDAQGEGVLAPGQTVTATATYTVTQADVDAGSVVNAATVSGQTPGGGTTEAEATRTVATPGVANVRIQKVGVASNGFESEAGDTIAYTFTVVNSGTVTLRDIVVTDALDGVSTPIIDWSTSSDPDGAAAETLAPGASVEATATYTITQADIDGDETGSRVRNEASVVATGANDVEVTASTDYTVPFANTPSIEIDKSHRETPTAAGQTLTYDFVVTNNGRVTLEDVVIEDELEGLSDIAYAWPDPERPGVLLTGQVVRATATIVVTQEAFNAGSIENRAVATGTPPTGGAVDADDDVTTFVQAASVSLQKETVGGAGLEPGAEVGDPVDYRFVVENTGNVTLTALSIADQLAGVDETIVFDWSTSDPATPAGELAPGETVEATGTYALTLADLDAGTLTNVASVSAEPPLGDPVEAEDSVTDPVPQTPGITLDKTADVEIAELGDEVTYTFTATNSGSVTLRDVTIADPMPGLTPVAIAWADSTDDATGEGVLSPGEVVTGTATYEVTQDDVDAGGIDNTATARGVGSGGGIATDTGSARVDADARSDFEFTKGVQSIDYVEPPGIAGSVITYVFAIENTGTTRLTGADVDDPLDGLGDIAWAWPGAPGVVPVGETVTGTATYTVTQADVDAGGVTNAATATVSPPSGDPLTSEEQTVFQPLVGVGDVTLTKVGEAEDGPASVAGQEIAWTFTIRNSGSLTLTVGDDAISDELAGISDPTIDWSTSSDDATGEGTLAPGETVRATATSTITQAQVDAGIVTNDATVSATPAQGSGPADPDPVTDDARADVPFAGTPLLVLTKSHDEPERPLAVGDYVDYRFLLVNDGTVTVDGIELLDGLDGVEDLTIDWSTAANEGVLAPQENVTATARLQVTQADVDRGRIDNVATATGVAPGEAPVEATGDDTVLLSQAPSIRLTKTDELQGSDADGSIAYGFEIENDGNLTLEGVTLTDELEELGPITIDWTGSTDDATGEGVLSPGEIVRGTATYDLTQADVDEGSVRNVATVDAVTIGGIDVTDSSSVVTVLPQLPGIAIEKTATPVGLAAPFADPTIRYDFRVVNTGNVTLTGVAIADELAGLPEPTVDWAGSTDSDTGEGTLSPGETVLASATYAVTQADIDAGGVDNEATAAGDAPNGLRPSATDEVTVPIATTASLALTKSTDAVNPGLDDTIEYTFELVNDGDVTVRVVSIVDEMEGVSDVDVRWGESSIPATPAGTLAPGERVPATATYLVRQSDVDSPRILNSAIATGQPDRGAAVTTRDAVEVPMDAVSSIELDKTGEAENGAASVAGDEVAFTFDVRNSGATTLTGVTLTDALPGVSVPVFDWAGSSIDTTDPGVLAPGETVTATATYTLTQADVDRGGVVNEATVAGLDPRNVVWTDTDDVTVALEGTGAIELDKSTDSTPQIVGDEVVYTFVATNTGTVTLTDVEIDDPIGGLSSLTYVWPNPAFEGRLLPDEEVVATATLPVTQAHLDARGIDNTAVATGVEPGVGGAPGATVRDEDSATVGLPFRPDVTLEKTGTVLEARAGGDVRFDFEITNTGNVTLTLGDDAIVDELEGLGDVVIDWSSSTEDGTEPGELAPGEQVMASARYTLTQDDVERGSIVNDATVSGTAPGVQDGETVPVSDDDAVTVPIVGAPALSIVKSTEASDPSVGDTVTYTIVVENTGTVRLTDVDVVDAMLDDLVVAWPNPDAPGVLEVDEVATATGTHVVTPADADAGEIVNVATATGTGRGGDVDESDSHTLELVPSPDLTLEKVGTLEGTGRAGDLVTYVFTLTNTGDVTLRGVDLDDPLDGLVGPAVAWADSTDPDTGEGVLSRGESVQGSATYRLTQGDVDAGGVTNIATATATGPGGPLERTATEVVDVTGTALLDLEKSGVAREGAASVAGDVIDWTFTIENVGSLTLDGVALTDDDVEGLEIDWSTSSDDATGEGELSPGETVTATATSRISQGEVDAGVVTNTASVVGTPRDGGEPTEAEDTAEVVLEGTAGLAIEKSHVGEPTAVGDVVEYRFEVENVGTVTVDEVSVVDELPGLDGPTIDWSTSSDDATGEGVLSPGETVLATGSYVVTQADVDRGSIVNTATAAGQGPGGGDVVSPEDVDRLPLAQSPSIALTKTAEADGETAGSTVTYAFTVVNDGTVTLDGVSIADEMPGLSDVVVDWAGSSDPATGEGTLSPGETVTATATYVLTQADVDAGGVTNAATVEADPATCGDDPCVPVGDDDTVVTPLQPVVAMTFAKTADREAANVGDTITYAFAIENTGTATLADVSVDDRLEGLSTIDYAWPGDAGVLLPGERVTATATYVVTQADAEAGGVLNVATAAGTPPGGPEPVRATDGVEVDVPPPGTTIPRTGSPMELGLALAALLLVLAGAVLLVRRREGALGG